MQRRGSYLLWFLCGLSSCVGLTGPPPPDSPLRSEDWAVGRPILQGFVGVQRLDTFERTGGVEPPIERDGRWLNPLIGGGGQWKLAGSGLDVGLEGMLALSWRARAGAIASGPGGTQVVVDVNHFTIELFGGPFVSLFPLERLRFYAGAGPLLQFVEFDQKAVPAEALGEDFDRSTSGFGVGLYARTGFEFLITSNTWLGLGVRWSESVVDLGRGMGDLDLEAVQFVLSMSNF
jgi:hypothetical protein